MTATLQNRLRELRKSNGFSQEEIANKLNISTSAYGFYEQGKTTPGVDVLNTLADLYDVTVDYLLGRSSNPRLNRKDERDIVRQIEALEESLENSDELMFHGEIMDDETRELLMASLRQAVVVSKIKAKKFTPKKYRGDKNNND